MTDSQKIAAYLAEKDRIKKHPSFRMLPQWEMCFNSWLDTESPSAARDWLADRENLLPYLDSLTERYLTLENQMEDAVEAAKEVFPMWEETEEEQNPLTEQEEMTLRAIRDEAIAAAEKAVEEEERGA